MIAKSRSSWKMGYEPTLCPDCSYPPNLIVTALSKDDFEDGRQRYDVRCRECGDYWIEIDEEEDN